MRHFLRLIELARTNGIVGVDKQHNPKVLEPRKDFWDRIAECQPFVFAPKNDNPHNLDPLSGITPVIGPDERSLDAPFRCFSLEMTEGFIAVPKPEDGVKLWIECIFVVEISPGRFAYTDLLRDENDYQFVFASNAEGGIVEQLLQRLRVEAVGTESVRQAVKIGTGKEKRTHRIKRLVHVTPKKQQEAYTATSRHAIVWTHRWAVRGHWRKLEGGLGKDRNGNYSVSGWTWVSEHTKGPEEAPLISKTRLIVEPKKG